MIIDGQHEGIKAETSYTSVPFEHVRKVYYFTSKAQRNEMESHDFLRNLGLLHREETGRPIIRSVLRRFGGPEAASQFDDAVDNAKANGGNWLQILLMILPLVLSLFGGGGNIQTIIQQIIAAISGLFPQPTPTPTPGK